MVGAAGVEPATYCTRGNRAARLRHAPILVGLGGIEPPLSGTPNLRNATFPQTAEWRPQPDLNRQPCPRQGPALHWSYGAIYGVYRCRPGASWVQTKCAAVITKTPKKSEETGRVCTDS